jgi:diaminopimelate epimerase
MAGWLDAGSTATIATAAGDRVASVERDGHPTMVVAVDMGPVSNGGAEPGSLRHRLVPRLAASLDVGNPHLVLLVDDLDAVEPLSDGPAYQAQFPDSVNVEWITVREPGTIDLVVYERGAGLTQACGSGATAAAVAASRWGVVDGSVTVRMPGGTAEVRLPPGSGSGGEPTGAGASQGPVLVGPATYVASIELASGPEAEPTPPAGVATRSAHG